MERREPRSPDPESGRNPQRRRRPPLSCTECRRRKLRCDRSLPCGQCIRSKTADACVFAGPQPGPSDSLNSRMSPPIARMQPPSGSDDQSGEKGGMFVFDSKLGPSSNSHRIFKRSRPDELHDMRQRLRLLENALTKTSSLNTPENTTSDVLSDLGISQAPESIGVDDRVRFLPDASFRGKKAKTRYFGRSHYTTTVSFFCDLGIFMRKYRGNSKDKEYTDVKQFKCELWSRETQNHQREFQEQAFNLEEMIPPRPVADELLHLYLETFETTYRVLHVPSFLKQYSDHWARIQPPDMAFVAQLLAVMAAGSCFYVSSDQYGGEAPQKSALKWIMAVQSYISCTFVSPDIDLRMIQIQTLLLVARLGVASDGDVAWASSGSLIRSAMTMGLHRDPTRFRKAVPYWSEMRRRLWATIVELDLKISLDRGVPPSMDLDECDCDPPSNWDDADLTEDMKHDPAPLGMTGYTRTFYQVLLAKTLPLRYRVAKKINSLKFDLSYDDALRMSEELVQYMQTVTSLFDDHASGMMHNEAGQRRFPQSLHLFIIRKFLLALHRPFSLSVARLPKCSYSRKICLENSLEILSQMELPPSPETNLYPHITQLGSGMFRDETFHAAVTVCVELILQANEMSHSVGLSMEGTNSSVLLSMIQSQQGVMLKAVDRITDDFGRRIDPSGKGCKPYYFMNIILASVKSRINGEEPQSKVEAASKMAVRVCRALLNGVPWPEAKACGDCKPAPIPTAPGGLTPTSRTPSDLDPASLLSTDLTDFTPMDLGGWFDGLDYGGPELWDSDFLGNLPWTS